MWITTQVVPLVGRRRGPHCAHVGPGRRSLRVSIMRHNVLTGSRRCRVAALPTFRLCCKRSVAARFAWWQAVDKILDDLEASSPKFGRERRQLEHALREWVSRPKGATVTKRAAKEARRAALAAEEAAIAERMRPTAPCWDILGVPPGVGSRHVKEGLNETLAKLHRRGASLQELREASDAAHECLERLRTGVW